MGVPALFRWLATKYPKIVQPVIDERRNPEEVSISNLNDPNPNGVEFDNLYLDMNGIIHPCCHPQDGPEPPDEPAMMEAIFAYTDQIFSMIRPRRLLYLAIDGVAPRAKMNQQRARRFRAAYDRLQEGADGLVEDFDDDGVAIEASGKFDSNCITPGTPFMSMVADALRTYIRARILSGDPAWQRVCVILSDSNVPGEGEHKIVDFIRRQRVAGLENLLADEEILSKDGFIGPYNPNQVHCIYGLDADLIMLSMATHEPRFYVLREDVFAQEAEDRQRCRKCRLLGHFASDCHGVDPTKMTPQPFKKFIFLRVDVLREYLGAELQVSTATSSNLERAIDDWIFMCFFVGNDFLPHLPSMDIREGAIDILIGIYKNVIAATGGYICNGGVVDFKRAEAVMRRLAVVEPEIFRLRHEKELRRRSRNERQQPAKKQEGADLMDAALATKRAHPDDGNDEDATKPIPHDEIRWHEPGARGRYYDMKMHSSSDFFVNGVIRAYVEGLAWVMAYYYRGCPSWGWYYPYHYAPWAADLVDIGGVELGPWTLGRPFRPFDQLMSVFPAASAQHIPAALRPLMTSSKDDSLSIVDFYPATFPIDMNGKQQAWQGVALLPFIDEGRLLAAVDAALAGVAAEDLPRNVLGVDHLYRHHSLKTIPFYGTLEDEADESELITAKYKVPHAERYDIGYLHDLFPGTKPTGPFLTPTEADDVRRGASAVRFPNILDYRPPAHQQPYHASAHWRPSSSNQRDYNRNEDQRSGGYAHQGGHDRDYNNRSNYNDRSAYSQGSQSSNSNSSQRGRYEQPRRIESFLMAEEAQLPPQPHSPFSFVARPSNSGGWFIPPHQQQPRPKK